MFKRIAPTFLNRLDTVILTKYPILWMSKIHYVLWYGIILWAFSALLGLIMPINLKERIQYEFWYFLFTVIAVLLLCFWIYRYLIFNKEKNYGKKKYSEEYKNFILVFITIAVFLLSPWPFEIIYKNRIAAMYTHSEVLEDINGLNETEPYMAHSSNNYFSWYDSTNNNQYFTLRKLNPYDGNSYAPYIIRYDSMAYPQLFTDFQIAKKYRPLSDPQLVSKKIEAYISIAQKYNIAVTGSAGEITKRYLDYLSREKILSSEFYNYGTYQYELQLTFENLCFAKFSTLFIFDKIYLWVMFYIIISLTSFLLLFKISYWQQFLIMLVILLLYPLIMFIFMQLMPYDSFIRGTSFYEASILALILFSLVTVFITARNSLHFKPVYNIFNQLFYVSFMYSPLLVLVFLHDFTNIFHNHGYGIYGDEMPVSEQMVDVATDYYKYLDVFWYNYWQEEYHRWLELMKYSGITAFIIALPFFKQLFVKQISLPEK